MSEPHADYGRWKNSCCWLAVSEPRPDYGHWKNNFYCIALYVPSCLAMPEPHAYYGRWKNNYWIVLPCMFPSWLAVSEVCAGAKSLREKKQNKTTAILYHTTLH